jgi:hypothetical protein
MAGAPQIANIAALRVFRPFGPLAERFEEMAPPGRINYPHRRRRRSGSFARSESGPIWRFERHEDDANQAPGPLCLFALATIPALPVRAEIRATATRSLTVQPTGPRQGENGSRYFNVEGVKKDRYASFGVLVFGLPKGGDRAGEVERPSLRLVQGVARFAQDGKVKFFLAEPPDRAGDPLAGLRFEAGSPGGVARDAFKALHPLGSGTFTKAETGHADKFEVKPEEGGRRYLRDRIRAGGTVLIIVAPEDEEAAAT